MQEAMHAASSVLNRNSAGRADVFQMFFKRVQTGGRANGIWHLDPLSKPHPQNLLAGKVRTGGYAAIVYYYYYYKKR